MSIFFFFPCSAFALHKAQRTQVWTAPWWCFGEGTQATPPILALVWADVRVGWQSWREHCSQTHAFSVRKQTVNGGELLFGMYKSNELHRWHLLINTAVHIHVSTVWKSILWAGESSGSEAWYTSALKPKEWYLLT